MAQAPHDTADRAVRANRGLAYQPALDGIRAVAIVAVLLYHGGVSWAQGGFLGVEAFFVLSGFLITSLLVSEWTETSAIRLGRFWARRGRRLLPALFCLVAVVGFYQAAAGASKAVPDLLADGLATLLYVGNWHQIWTGSGYFARSALPSPLQHTWSLAIEEQFYVVWPLVVLGVLRLIGRHGAEASTRTRALKVLFGAAVAGSLASALEMTWLYHGGPGLVGLNRVYYGTDTRAQGLLAGAALAFGLALWHRRPEGVERSRHSVSQWALGLLGVAGIAAIVVGMHLAGGNAGNGGGLYRGGFLVFDIVAVALITSVVLAPRMPAGRLLAAWPLRSIGQISYGLYLWHYPLFLWLDEQTTGLAGWGLLALRIGVTFAVALVSYLAVEQPIRQRRWPAPLVRVLALPGAAVAVAALVVASSVPAAAGSLSGTDLYRSGSGPTTTITPLAGAASWAGDQGPCRVRLPTSIPAVGTFHTCPPVRVMLVGDSIALTLAYGIASDAQQFGVLFSSRALIGCSFGVKGLGEWSGQGYLPQYAPCLTQFATWRKQEAAFHPQALVVLMGYWDCFDREWNGRDVHIGEPAFDAYLFSRMELFVRTDGAGGIPIVLLTVPYVDPAPFANGSPAPAASPQRHSLINQMLARLAATFPNQVHLVDTDSYVSPGDHFDSTIDGHECRWSDGIHFYPFCGAVVGEHVLPLVRQLVEADGGPGPSGAPSP
ncbi:MAG: acyltransferase family protein [Acidimicrobiales bacterium]